MDGDFGVYLGDKVDKSKRKTDRKKYIIVYARLEIEPEQSMFREAITPI